MTLRLHPEAEREIDEAFAFYESRAPGVGRRFIAAIEHGYDQIEAFPNSWPIVAQGARWYLTRRFPYGIVYVVREDVIVVVAVIHLRRRRNYWIARLRQLSLKP